MLNFEIADDEGSESESGAKKSFKNTVITKNENHTFISVYAIPVFDGHLISSENDIQENLIEFGEMNVDLINDFDIPWVLKKSAQYPKYRRTRRKKRDAGEGEGGLLGDEDNEDYGEEDQEGE